MASSKFSGLGELADSAVMLLPWPTWGVGLLARDLPLEGKVRFVSGIRVFPFFCFFVFCCPVTNVHLKFRHGH